MCPENARLGRSPEEPGEGPPGGASHEAERRFRAAFEGAAHGMAVVSPEGRWLMANRAISGMVGYTDAELRRIDFQRITHPDDLDADLALVRRTLAGEIDRYELEKRYVHKSGRVVPVLLSVCLVRDDRGHPLYFVSQVIDLTRLREAEARLAQARRLELVGKFTGGVAHDFNNLLTVVLGNLDMLRERLAEDPHGRKQLEAAAHAAGRGAELTRSLLAFARRQPLEPRPADPNAVVARVGELLDRTLREDVRVQLEAGAGVGPICVDVGQLESALLNLAVNARDAMAETGGTLTIATREVEVGPADAARSDGDPGRYVVVEVQDTGCGMSAEVQDSAVEPFFTTKEPGRGSGLGLSTVFGFAAQSGGFLTLASREGQGTTVRLHFPRFEGEILALSAGAPLGARTAASGRGRRILVVEDEGDVRRVAKGFLASLGYEVFEAGSGPEALALVEQQPELDLLFSDIVMPGGMSGEELAAEVCRRRPAIRVLLTSGYNERAPRRSDGPKTLPKPYRLEELAARVEEELRRASP